MIKIAITDDQVQVRESLKNIIELLGDELELIYAAKDGEEIVNYISNESNIPDIILMDVEMRKMDGIRATKKVKALNPEIKILILTMFDNEPFIEAAFQEGADGYLLKGEKPLKMLELIKATLEGRFPMSPEVAQKTMSLLRSETAQKTRKTPQEYRITKRELEILKFLTQGQNYISIADQLCISPQTVRTHFDNIYRKLEVNSKLEAANIALKHKWF